MAARKTPGGGRKPGPAGKRDRRISINVTPGDHDRITVAAGGRPVAAWCAEVVGRASEAVPGESIKPGTT